MTQPTILTGQDIGRAQRATAAVLNQLLARVGVDFTAWVILNTLGTHENPPTESDLVDQVRFGLKIDAATATASLGRLLERGLVAGTTTGAGSLISLTRAGRGDFDAISAGIAQIAERLYGDLPTVDLVVAHRILAAVADRADAELLG